MITTDDNSTSLATAGKESWRAVIDALPIDLRCFESGRSDDDGRVDGHQLEKLLAGLMNACGGNPFEWISTRSLAADAPYGTFNRIPLDWQSAYRWLEVSVVHGGSEGWVVHVRGVLRNRLDDGKELSELLVSAKALNRDEAWRAAQIFAHFFDC
jgi:hypothetical protein